MPQKNTKLLSSICELMAPESFALNVLNASLNGLYVFDVKLRKNIFINTQYTRLTGYTLNDLQTMDEAQFFALFHPEDQQRVADHMERILLNSDEMLEIEYRFKTKEGRWTWCLSRDSVFARNEDGAVSQFIGTFFDITDRKQLENTLASQRELLQSIFDNIPVMLVIWDEQLQRFTLNRHAEKVLGWTTADANKDDFMSKVYPDTAYREKVAAYMQSLEPGWREWEVATKDGGRVISEWANIRLSDDTMIGIGVDITERKRSEEALYESNQELNEYAYALTHNLKAPLRAIHNYVNFLSEDLADTLKGEPKTYIEGMKSAITLTNKQFEDLETLYRIKNHPLNFEPFKMSELLDEIKSIFMDTPDRKLILEQDWPVFRGERFLLRQILIELVNNGFKFNQTDIRRVEVGWQQATGNGIEMFVRDNGIGIDPQHKMQIFDIFKRLHTEREYEGTGIGLAVVKRAFQKLGGKLRVESAIGEGSTFYINFPNSLLEKYQTREVTF
jgi:two-component system CheB/CheR fusion protein